MDGCTEYTNVTGAKTTTIFMKDNVIMGKRVVETKDKRMTETWYNAEDKIHREGQPAIVCYKDDKIIHQLWYKDGKLHRDGQPAIIDYEDGKITNQMWSKDGVAHLAPKPAESITDILARIRADLAEIEARLAEIGK